MSGDEQVVRVDLADRDLGACGKLAAHQQPGVLHRAISVLLFDGADRLLVQRRAWSKHHFRGRWSNSACSHPRPGEAVVDAGRRRIREELGLVAELAHHGSFRYHAIDADSGLVEHELDHVLVGRAEGVPQPDPAEVAELRWVAAGELVGWLQRQPAVFTPWFVPVLATAAAGGTLPGRYGTSVAGAPWTR